MPTAREIVLNVLSRWRKIEDPPHLPERDDRDWARLETRDRAFAFDLLTGILRWRGTLDIVIASQLKQPLQSLDQSVHLLLLMGAYQLLIQREPAYAAVDATVTLARTAAPRAGGLINAVLRGITRLEPKWQPRSGIGRNRFAVSHTEEVIFNRDLFTDPKQFPIAHLSQTRSHPGKLAVFLTETYGLETAGDIMLANNRRPFVTCRVDASSIDVPATLGLVPHETPRYLVAAEGWSPDIETLVHAGKLSPQDPTAGKPIRALAERNLTPATILDLCAGLGTKTVQLARTFPQAQVTGTDIDDLKLARLQKRVDELQLKNARSAAMSTLKSPASFQLVLADVPCSNTGVMARRVQSRWRWPALDHVALRSLQARLLQQAADLTAAGCTVVYATCSIDPRENDQVVQTVLKLRSDLTLEHQETTVPQAGEANQQRDGGYFAILRRS